MKAFFDIAVQAMNDKADQVGRSTTQNEGMINVQVARTERRTFSARETGICIDFDFRSSELDCWYINSQGQHHLQGIEERGELRDEEWTCLPRLG